MTSIPTIVDDHGRTWFVSDDEDLHETYDAARERNEELARLTAYIEQHCPELRSN